MAAHSRKSQKPRDPQASTAVLPYVPTTPAEWSAVAAMANAGLSGAKILLDQLRGKGGTPADITVQVVSSEYRSARAYVIGVQVTNYGAHGVYLEDFALTPKDGQKSFDVVALGVEGKTSAGISFPDEKGDGRVTFEPIKPILIAPGLSTNLTVTVAVDAKSWTSQATDAILKVTTTVVSGPERDPITCPVRIRQNSRPGR